MSKEKLVETGVCLFQYLPAPVFVRIHILTDSNVHNSCIIEMLRRRLSKLCVGWSSSRSVGLDFLIFT